MKRLGLFVIALVFAFCTTVMAVSTPCDSSPATAETKAVDEKADVAKVKKHHKKHHKECKCECKEAKKEMKEVSPAAPAHAPAVK